MEKQCQGCGVKLQCDYENEPGYVKSMEMDYCARCFRLNHYGDTKHLKQSVCASEILNEISKIKNSLYVWIIDSFHLTESGIPSIARWLGDNPVMVILTKREVLPLTMSSHKIKQAIQPFIKESQLNVVDVIITSKKGKEGKELVLDHLMKLKQSLSIESFVFFGRTNAGKSSLLNTLFVKDQHLSVSAYPSTTLDLIKLETPIGCVYDTPGIDLKDSVLNYLPLDAIKELQPRKQIRPINFQLQGNQSILIDRLAIINFENAQNLSVTLYFPECVQCHRCKTEKALEQFNKQDGCQFCIEDAQLKTTFLKTGFNGFDLVIDYIGFISIKGMVSKVSITCDTKVAFSQRKVLI